MRLPVLVTLLAALAGVCAAECDYDAFSRALQANATPVVCAGGADGTVKASFAEGSGCQSAFFTLRNGTSQSSSADGVFEGLGAGDYVLSARFNDTATADINVAVGSATAIKFDVAPQTNASGSDVCGDCAGSANVTVTGGTPPYTYNKTTQSTAFVLSGLCYGTVEFAVVDSAGCSASTQFVLSKPAHCAANTTSSTGPEDYWALPDGMLPWLLAACVLVAVFVVAMIVSCAVWCTVSEHNPSEPAFKTIEQRARERAEAEALAEVAAASSDDEADADYSERETAAEELAAFATTEAFDEEEAPAKKKKEKEKKAKKGKAHKEEEPRADKPKKSKSKKSKKEDDDGSDVSLEDMA